MTALGPLVVAALGGNASYPPHIRGEAQEQLDIITGLCERLVEIVRAGYRLLLTHGNGPVVGNILFRMMKTAAELPAMPMDVCVAHSQGGLGYMFQQCFANTLVRHGLEVPVVAVLSQVEVDPLDPAFAQPTKPVGRFFSKEFADSMARQLDWTFVEDSGRGYRRVVPSPMPKRILGIEGIRALLAAGMIPITAGGGGIAVVCDAAGEYHGAAAVIDKDLTSALLASALGASTLLLLTGVEQVAVDFGKPAQRFIDTMTAGEARALQAQGQFPPGSMGPKIQAALNYLDAGGREVVVTSLERAFDGIEGRAGTRIVPG